MSHGVFCSVMSVCSVGRWMDFGLVIWLACALALRACVCVHGTCSVEHIVYTYTLNILYGFMIDYGAVTMNGVITDTA